MAFDIDLHTPKDFRRFFLNTRKYSEQVQNEFEYQLQQASNEWVDRTKDALSNYYPDWLKHDVRPDADFPHLNTGSLRDSPFARVTSHVTASGKNISFKTLVGIKSQYGTALNAGYKRRKDGVVPSWVGWQDRIFHEATSETQTVAELFDWLHDIRTGVAFYGN